MLGARVATALVLVAAFLAAVFWLPLAPWRAVVAAVVGTAAWEWAGLAGWRSSARTGYGLMTAAAAWILIVIALPGGSPRPEAAFVFAIAAGYWIVVAPWWLRQKWRIRSALIGCLVGWLVLLPPALALVQLRELSPILLLAAMALVWVADIAAYFAGRAWGRRKLAPSISPGKTWEGVIGASAAVLLYGLGVLFASGQGALLGFGTLALFAGSLVVMTALSILGDLFESLLKRQAGVKDSSHLLPGHGGVLDRIDSLTSTLPLVGLTVMLWSQ